MDQHGSKLTREEAFLAQKLATQRENLFGVCRLCVKSLVDKSSFESINDDCPHVADFCTIMEHIFTHRLQFRWTLFGSNEPIEFWQTIMKFAPPSTVTSVQDMEEIQTNLGRARAWIRLSLVQKKLSEFMHSLVEYQDALREFYLPGAFLCGEHVTELAGTFKCLDAIDFNLCLRGHDFDFGEKREISYFPYLKFHQSSTSIADDDVEEHKLLGQESFERVKLPNFEGLDLETFPNGGTSNISEQSFMQLKECIKTERDQKNYFEELVCVRDTQVNRLQTELATCSEESERNKKELEAIVLELQDQVTKLQSELRESQREKRSKRRDSDKDVASCPETETSSRKKRSGSMLTGWLRSASN